MTFLRLSYVVLFALVLYAGQAVHGQTLAWSVTDGLYTNSTAAGWEGRVQNVVCDEVGNVYTCGKFSHSTTFDGIPTTKEGYPAYVLKRDPKGQQQWICEVTDSGYRIELVSMAIDAGGNLYAVGHFREGMRIGVTTYDAGPDQQDGLLVKISPQGQLLWHRVLSGDGPISISGICLDKNGHVYFTGYFAESLNLGALTLTTSSSSRTGIFVARYNPQGNLVIARRIAEHYYNPLVHPVTGQSSGDVRFDSRGNLLVTGSFRGTLSAGGQTLQSDSLCGFVIKYSSFTANTIHWVVKAGECAGAMAIDSTGKVYVTGLTRTGSDSIVDQSFGLAPQTQESFIAVLDSNGSLLWMNTPQKTGGSQYLVRTWARCIDIDPDGFVYFSMYVSALISVFCADDPFYEAYLFKLTPSLDSCVYKVRVYDEQMWGGAGVVTDNSGTVYWSVTTGWNMKSHMYFNDDTTVADSQQTEGNYLCALRDQYITTDSISPLPICKGESFRVHYRKYHGFKPGNVFSVELSDLSGNFDNSIVLASVTDTASGYIDCIFPASLPTGAGYKIRVNSSTPRRKGFVYEKTFHVFDKPKVNAGEDQLICFGDTLALNAKGAHLFAWNADSSLSDTAVAKPNAFPLVPTSYYVTGKDINIGCVNSDTVFVNLKPGPTLETGDDTLVCLGQKANLTATGHNGDSLRYYFEWRKAIDGSFIGSGTSVGVSPDTTTLYFVTLYDSCSVVRDSAWLTVSVREPVKVTPRSDTLVCLNEALPVWANASGGTGNYSYRWQDTRNIDLLSSDSLFTFAPDTSASLQVIAGDGCSPDDTATVIINVRDPLKITPVTGALICYGEVALLDATATGGTGNYTFDWLGLGSGPQNVQPFHDSDFVVVVSDQCSPPDTGAVRITVKAALEVKADSVPDICEGSAVTLSASGLGGEQTNYTFTWDQGLGVGNNLSVQPPASTSYVVTLTDGCSFAAYDTVPVKVVPIPVALFSASDSIGCPPLEPGLSDLSLYHDPLLNQWEILGPGGFSSGQANPALTEPGSYDVGLTVFNSLGCSDKRVETKKLLVHPRPFASFEVHPLARQTDNELLLVNTGSGASFYHWDLDDGNFYTTYEDTLKYIYTDSGTFEVSQIAVNKFGCSDTAVYGMKVYLSPFCAIPNAISVNRDGRNEVFAPECSGISSYKMSIMNRWGQILLNCENCAWDGTFGGQPAPSGVYYYRIDITSPISGHTYAVGAVHVLR